MTVRRLCLAVAVLVVGAVLAEAAPKKGKDSAAAAKTRQKLKQKVTVDYDDTPLKEIVRDLQDQFDKKLSFKIDTDHGVSNNIKLKCKATDKPLAFVLDKLLSPAQLGYVVVSAPKRSDPQNRLDGWILIKRGKERGFAAGEEAGGGQPAKDKDQAAEDKPGKDKKKAKDKAAKAKPKKAKPKKANADKDQKDAGEKGEDDPDKAEQLATAKLKLATNTMKNAKSSGSRRLMERAKKRYQELIDKYPNTTAAEKARAILKKLGK
jgi:hypothetical protein